jgi:hypothetical protein
MRRPRLSCCIVLCVVANSVVAEDAIKWIQCTSLADVNQVLRISQQLDELSPLLGSDGSSTLKSFVSQYPFDIVFDERALEDENISIEEPIKVPKVQRISIRNQLKLILGPMQLVYQEMPGYLLVTSKHASANVVRLYDVSSYVRSTRGEYNYTPLVRMIEGAIFQDEWVSFGGNSSIEEWRTPDAAILVVVAPSRTHEAICDLFSAQRQLLVRPKPSNTTRRLTSLEQRASLVRRSSLGASGD